MLVCPGCGGRNPPQVELCPFCHRRLGARGGGAHRPLVQRVGGIFLGAVLVIAVLIGVGLLVLARTAS
jgi:hypothetical protein